MGVSTAKRALSDEKAAQTELAAGNTAGYNQDMATAQWLRNKASKGNFFSSLFSNPFTKILTDIGLTLSGNPEFIPIANAAETKLGGGSWGDAALSGGEALAGQELAGAVGIGQGNTAFNNALGITGDNPAGTGLPDIGSSFDRTLNSLNPFSSGGGVDATTGIPVGQSYASDLNGTPTGVSGGMSPMPGTLPSTSGVPGAPGVAAPAAAGAGASPPSLTTVTQALGQGNFSDALKQVGSSISPMTALAGVGLGANALMGNKTPSATTANKAIAQEQSSTGTNLVQMGQAGTLPPGQMQALQTELDQGIASIRSRYAEMGMSGSTSEQQAIQQARDAFGANVASLAQNEVTQGLSALGQAGGTNTALAQNQIQEDQGLQEAIARLAGIPSGFGQTQKPAA